MEKWVRIEANPKGIFFSVESQKEEPMIRFVCEPVNPNEQACQMLAIVPESLKEDIVNVWKELVSEEDETIILSKLLALVLEVDDNPDVRMRFNNYMLRIEINSPD